MIARTLELYGALRCRGIALVGAAALLASVLLVLSRPIVMLVDGERIESDVPPVTTARRAFVPLRSIADALGAQTEVDTKTGVVSVTLGDRSLHVRVGDTRATIDGTALTLQHAPFRIRGRVMISLDAVARALRVRARYDARRGRIVVITPGIGITRSR